MSTWRKCALLWLGGIASPMIGPVQLEPLSAAEQRMPDTEAPPPATDSEEAGDSRSPSACQRLSGSSSPERPRGSSRRSRERAVEVGLEPNPIASPPARAVLIQQGVARAALGDGAGVSRIGSLLREGNAPHPPEVNQGDGARFATPRCRHPARAT
jgi:hypothetical protein